jgi:hypothetical protein
MVVGFLAALTHRLAATTTKYCDVQIIKRVRVVAVDFVGAEVQEATQRTV